MTNAKNNSLDSKKDIVYANNESAYAKKEGLYTKKDIVYVKNTSLYVKNKSLDTNNESLYAKNEGGLDTKNKSLDTNNESVDEGYPEDHLCSVKKFKDNENSKIIESTVINTTEESCNNPPDLLVSSDNPNLRPNEFNLNIPPPNNLPDILQNQEYLVNNRSSPEEDGITDILNLQYNILNLNILPQTWWFYENYHLLFFIPIFYYVKQIWYLYVLKFLYMCIFFNLIFIYCKKLNIYKIILQVTYTFLIIFNIFALIPVSSPKNLPGFKFEPKLKFFMEISLLLIPFLSITTILTCYKFRIINFCIVYVILVSFAIFGAYIITYKYLFIYILSFLPFILYLIEGKIWDAKYYKGFPENGHLMGVSLSSTLICIYITIQEQIEIFNLK